MQDFITVSAPDDPEGTRYKLAPDEIAQAIQRRFARRPVVFHPEKPNVFIYDPGNFWDGPTHVRWEPETGHFYFSGWYGQEHFPLIGPIQ